MAEQGPCFSCQHGDQDEYDDYGSGDIMSQLFGVGPDGSSAWMADEVIADEIQQCFEGECFDAEDDPVMDCDGYGTLDVSENTTQDAFQTDCSALKRRYQPFKFLRRNPFFGIGRRNMNVYRNLCGEEIGVEERPRKRHLCLSLVCVILAFVVISWRRGNFPLSPKLFPARAIPPPNTCGRHPTWFARGVALAGLTTRMVLGADWAGFGTHYCGPLNGADFTLPPIDVLDAMCAQHDFCIERSRYLVSASGERLLYPIGVVDDDDFQRCGIPLQSHSNPNYGTRIKACDEEFLVRSPEREREREKGVRGEWPLAMF